MKASLPFLEIEVPIVFLAVLLLACAPAIWMMFRWSNARISRGSSMIRQSLEQEGYRIMQMKRRQMPWQRGPFTWASRSDVIFRVEVEDRDGKPRTAWGRWGRDWPWDSDRLHVRWEQ